MIGQLNKPPPPCRDPHLRPRPRLSIPPRFAQALASSLEPVRARGTGAHSWRRSVHARCRRWSDRPRSDPFPVLTKTDQGLEMSVPSR
jgi:hypothetical protein